MNKKHQVLKEVVYGQLFQYKSGIAIAMTCSIGYVLMTLLVPWPMKFIFDYVLLGNIKDVDFYFSDNQYIVLIVLSLSVIFIALMRGLFSYYQSCFAAKLGSKIVFNLRCVLFSHFQSLPLSFHQNSQTGEILTKLTTDTAALKDIFSDSLIMIFTQVLLITGMFIVMFIVNWKLSIIILLTFPIIITVLYVMYSRLRKTVREQRRQEGKVAARTNEVLSAIPLVQAYAREDYESERFNKVNKLTMEQGINAARLEALTTRTAEIVTAFGTALVILVGSLYALDGSMSPGDVLVFVSYVRNIYKPIRSIAKLTTKFSHGMVSIERISEILETEPGIVDSDHAINAPKFYGELKFSSVSFQYDSSNNKALKNISFTIFPGQKVALVGPSGAGKSTIAKLILRLIEPHSGSVSIDNLDIKTFTRDSLREQIAVVLQNPVLFNTSIADNIGYGRLNASKEQIKSAARQANADSFISTFPDGYKTQVGERGSKLSGGQQQRISLARALIKEPAILLMDEATSALDAISERAIHKAIEKMQRNKTILMITHNMHLVEKFDHILVIEKGEVVEQGKHNQLMNLRGCYYDLYMAQQ
ncbi:MAG: ABC transporter ATP-binding protein/permease [Gammaproteobacteria bacterium]|nr:ABC transporter ATP-binding protein/permease [Gammaproteobacteria bacterium]